METVISYALTARIKKVLEEFVSSKLMKESDCETTKSVLLGIALEDDTELFDIFSSMLSLKYYLWKIETSYVGGKVFLTVNAQRRLDILDEYKDIPLCETNDKTLINLILSINTIGEQSMSMGCSLEISHESPDETWISINPYSLDLHRISTIDKLKIEESKVVKLWSYAYELYS